MLSHLHLALFDVRPQTLDLGPWTLNFGLLDMSAQLPTPAPGDIENWLIPAMAIASMALLVKKLFARRPRGDCPFVTKSELNQELSAVRDKIDARFLLLTEKIEHVG